MLGQAADFYISDDGAMRQSRGSIVQGSRFKVQGARFSDLKVQSDLKVDDKGLKPSSKFSDLKVQSDQRSMTRFSDQGQSDPRSMTKV
jgi:hypothetical protein